MDMASGYSHAPTTFSKVWLGPPLRMRRAPGRVRRSHFSFLEPKDWIVDFVCVAWLFWAVSTVQMLAWAAKKQRAYKKEFGKEYPRQRKAMIPFLF